MSYRNFVTPISFFDNSIARRNFYSPNHFYNPINYQIRSANQANMLVTENFYFTPKQNNVVLLICQNFNNRKNCLSTCQYKYFYKHYAGFYPAKNCTFNAIVLRSNLIPL